MFVQAEAAGLASVRQQTAEQAGGQGGGEVEHGLGGEGPALSFRPLLQGGRPGSPVPIQRGQQGRAGQGGDMFQPAQQGRGPGKIFQADQGDLVALVDKPLDDGLGLEQIAQAGEIDDVSAHNISHAKNKQKEWRRPPHCVRRPGPKLAIRLETYTLRPCAPRGAAARIPAF